MQGHHAADVNVVPSIMRDGFIASRNLGDWLGDGVYFWESNLSRAIAWAEEKHAANGRVLEVDIDLTGGIDFSQAVWSQAMTEAADRMFALLKSRGLSIPTQTGKYRTVDRLVINFLVEELVATGIEVPTVRGIFPEGEPVFPGSGVLTESHVQIAVRDTSRISNVRLVEIGTTVLEGTPLSQDDLKELL